MSAADQPAPTGQLDMFGGHAEICIVEKDPTRSGLESMDDRKHTRYCQRHAALVADIAEIGLPKPGQQFRLVTRRLAMKLTGMNEAQRNECPSLAPCCVAALFVQPDGCYAGLQGVDAWPEERDARSYCGPLPVIAHPPCQLWGALAAVNYAQWGGEHNMPGNDGGCFAAALDAVNKFGGVLEHPAKSRAFAAHGLPKPSGIGWQATIEGGWVCEVWQSAYGHRANKATWLYYCGNKPPLPLRWERSVGTHQVGYQDRRGKARNKPTLTKREANATPLEFRDELLKLALHSAT